MRKSMTIGLLAATTAVAAPAAAAPTILFTENAYNATQPGAVTLFNGFNSAPSSPTGVQYNPGVTSPVQTVVNTVEVYGNGVIVPGDSVDPSPTVDNGPYLSIGANSSYSVNFGASPQQYFSFILGSIDSYNTLTLVDAMGGVFSYTGRQIIGEAAVGPTNNTTTGRVQFFFNGGPGLASATFASSQTAFEIDQIQVAVPEPATWAMMIGGFGVVGGALRGSRRRKTTVAMA